MLWISFAAAATYVATVSGMDDPCCAQNVVTALQKVPGVRAVAASFEGGQACVDSSAPLAEAQFAAAFAGSEYALTALKEVPACPAGMTPTVDPWANVGSLDVKVISRGEKVDLSPVAGKFTVVDFGAPWCTPCLSSAVTLKDYLGKNADSAVRVVWLDAADAKASFAMPAVAQHLAFAEGLPWYKVLGPDGKKVYEGSVVADALAAIDKKRAR